MKPTVVITLLSAMSSSLTMAESPPTLVIHGGAAASRVEFTPERDAATRKVLEESLRAGFKVLEAGGSSTDAVVAAIVILEDSPLFNAGRGSVLTAAGTVEMDASVMEGATRKAGAAAGVQGVKNPILLSRTIMDKTRHVLLTGKGAEAFAHEQGLLFEPAEYFILPERVDELKRVREKEKAKTGQAPTDSVAPSLLIGTVGAVALDTHGHLAAGTSTGGMVNKRAGRVGDSPIIGAGTFAEDGVVAVSCTGHGEFFIRSAVAYDVAARMKYQGVTVDAAAREIIKNHLSKLGGAGGLIALDAKGNVTTPFNTQGMVRGSIRPGGSIQVAIFEE